MDIVHNDCVRNGLGGALPTMIHDDDDDVLIDIIIHLRSCMYCITLRKRHRRQTLRIIFYFFYFYVYYRKKNPLNGYCKPSSVYVFVLESDDRKTACYDHDLYISYNACIIDAND